MESPPPLCEDIRVIVPTRPYFVLSVSFSLPAEWSKITLTGKENDTDKTKYGRVGTITLMSSHSGGGLSINGYAVGGRTGTTGDYEYKLYTDINFIFSQPVGATYVRADINRFQNADATANNVTGTAVYGGYSSLGNTTTENKIKITNTNRWLPSRRITIRK